jgi:hypothetical protein
MINGITGCPSPKPARPFLGVCRDEDEGIDANELTLDVGEEFIYPKSSSAMPSMP